MGYERDIVPDPLPAPESPRSHSPWVWPVTLLLIILLLVGAGTWLAWQTLSAPARTLEKAGGVVKAVGEQAVEVASAFRTGRLRQEFYSQAVEMTGTTKLQVATLKQFEVFQNEEGGTVAWDLVELPKVVVQAQAPVEYSYLVDLSGPWEFRHDEKTLTVVPPPIEAGTPALDVSALKFFTIEGRLWPHETRVRERLRESVTGRLARRAQNNTDLVRELARRQIGSFVEKWVAERFSDGKAYQIKVVFPDELPAPLGDIRAP